MNRKRKKKEFPIKCGSLVSTIPGSSKISIPYWKSSDLSETIFKAMNRCCYESYGNIEHIDKDLIGTDIAITFKY